MGCAFVCASGVLSRPAFAVLADDSDQAHHAKFRIARHKG